MCIRDRRTGARVSGPIPLPTDKEVVTILRAVHKYKDSREQFEMRTHKRLIDILKPSNKTVEALTSLQLPAGVEIEIRRLWVRISNCSRLSLYLCTARRIDVYKRQREGRGD